MPIPTFARCYGSFVIGKDSSCHLSLGGRVRRPEELSDRFIWFAEGFDHSEGIEAAMVEEGLTLTSFFGVTPFRSVQQRVLEDCMPYPHIGLLGEYD